MNPIIYWAEVTVGTLICVLFAPLIIAVFVWRWLRDSYGEL